MPVSSTADSVPAAQLAQQTMPLFQLPPEILIQIFEYVGSSYFRSDLSRLTVCKQWSRFSHTACFRDFYVTQKTLRRLLVSPYMESSLSLVKDSAEILSLDLKGFEDWDSTPLSLHGMKDPYASNLSAWRGAHGPGVRAAWTTKLNNDLFHLATTINQSRKLRTLRIQAKSEQPQPHPLNHILNGPRRLPLLDRRDYLYLLPLRAFISTSNLTSLELDLCGTELIHRPRQGHAKAHVCTDIAALLTTLQRLHLRMRTICADVLKPQQQSTNLRLNEVLINMSLSNESSLTTAATHSMGHGPSSAGLLQLKANMEKQAQALAAQMEAPKVVRILTHAPPMIEMQAFDVLTGRRLRLSEGAEWDDDGEIIEEQVSDKESEISDLDWDDDDE